jgi:hypothetical protein
MNFGAGSSATIAGNGNAVTDDGGVIIKVSADLGSRWGSGPVQVRILSLHHHLK